jgi:Protein-glutamine gamma-glutamyltransferase
MASGRKFHFKGSTEAETNRSMRDHIAARVGVAKFAGGNSFRFASSGSKVKMNPEYWEDTGTVEWRLKDESKRKEAYQDLHVHPEEYAMGCKQAAVMTVQAGSGQMDISKDDNVPPLEWIPGDWGYIKNTGSDSPDSGEEGENIICLGNGKFWGVSNHQQVRTLHEWYDQVKAWDGAAEIEGFRKGPKVGLL